MADEIGLPFLEMIDHGTLGLFRIALFDRVENANVFFQGVFETFGRCTELVEAAMQEVIASDVLAESRTAAGLGNGVVKVLVEVGPEIDPVWIARF